MKKINEKAFNMIYGNIKIGGDYDILLEQLENKTENYYNSDESELVTLELGVQNALDLAKFALGLKGQCNMEVEYLNVDTLVNLALYGVVANILDDLLTTLDDNYKVTADTLKELAEIKQCYITFN